MKLATVLTPTSRENLLLAAQCGVTDVVRRYPGPGLEPLLEEKQRIAEFGLSMSVLEGYLPIERIKVGEDDGSDLEEMRQLIVNMGKAEIPILCYNFMAGTDWVRTKLDVVERGGALVTAFDLNDAEQAILLGHDSASRMEPLSELKVSEEQLWNQLESFLKELVPLAARNNVILAMHPDDPPLPEFMGKARIMNSIENFQRLLAIVDSPSNAICFCQGTFAEMGVDIPATIRLLGPRIEYVHFRDVRGSARSFSETFHDNGPTDMVAAVEAYREVGFTGPMRPDHVPQLEGEQDGEPGYTMMGRLFAYGYMRGLMQASENSRRSGLDAQR